MYQDYARVLNDKMQGFFNISKQMEQWADKLPVSKQEDLEIGKSLLKEARADLDYIIEVVNVIQDMDLPKKSRNGDGFNPLEKKVPDSQLVLFKPKYSRSVRYPSQAVPIFYGDPRFWPVFKESFQKVIHNSPYLSDTDKIEHLIGYLDGDALKSVSSIPPFEENYGKIWQALVARYEDPSAKFIRYDFSPRTHSPRTSIESYYYLQEVLDYCFIVHNTLTRLNFESLGDYVIHEITQSKLDPDMVRQLMKSLNADQIPTFDQTSGFLQHHIQKLDRMSIGMKKAQFRENQKLGRSQGLVTSTFDAKLCQFCKTSNHKLFNCKGFLELTPVNRYAYLKANNRCFNCLGGRHNVAMCLSENVCAFCKKKHHTLLHEEQIQLYDKAPMKYPFKEGANGPKITIPLHLVKEESVILATAAVQAFVNGEKFSIGTRALLDPASPYHLISNRCRKALNLPLYPLSPSVSGSEDIEKNILGTTVVKFSPHFNIQHTVAVVAYVIENVCSYLPTTQIAPTVKENLSNFRLADPQFDIPAPVDLLIGTEIFPLALKKQQYRIPNTFCFGLDTIFGWIVMGRAPAKDSFDPEYERLCRVNSITELFRRLQHINEFIHDTKYPESKDKQM